MPRTNRGQGLIGERPRFFLVPRVPLGTGSWRLCRQTKASMRAKAYALEDGARREIGRFAGAALVSAPPFEAMSINLDDLSAPTA